MGFATVVMRGIAIGICHGELAQFVVCVALGWNCVSRWEVWVFFVCLFSLCVTFSVIIAHLRPDSLSEL